MKINSSQFPQFIYGKKTSRKKDQFPVNLRGTRWLKFTFIIGKSFISQIFASKLGSLSSITTRN